MEATDWLIGAVWTVLVGLVALACAAIYAVQWLTTNISRHLLTQRMLKLGLGSKTIFELSSKELAELDIFMSQHHGFGFSNSNPEGLLTFTSLAQAQLASTGSVRIGLSVLAPETENTLQQEQTHASGQEELPPQEYTPPSMQKNLSKKKCQTCSKIRKTMVSIISNKKS